MSIETAITRAWQRRALWLWLLLPISWLYGLLTILRRQAYKTGLFASYRASIPVMVIGNITVGGSGKTPLIIALVHYLQQRGVQVGVISRGYGGDSSKMPAVVTELSLPSEVGDEPCLIVSMTGVAMSVCPNRAQAIDMLLEARPELQLIIADDGLQHYALQRDIEWIVVDVARGFGSQQLLPTGFLREPMVRLKEATVIHHEKPNELLSFDNHQQIAERLTMQLQPDSLQLLWQPSVAGSQMYSEIPLSGHKVHAVSGIGYPQRFFATVSALGFEVIAHPYPDHYDFSVDELLQYEQYPIIVTSKDAIKIRVLLLQEEANKTLKVDYYELASRLWVLPVTAVLSDTCYDKLEQQLVKFNIHITNDNRGSEVIAP